MDVADGTAAGCPAEVQVISQFALGKSRGRPSATDQCSSSPLGYRSWTRLSLTLCSRSALRPARTRVKPCVELSPIMPGRRTATTERRSACEVRRPDVHACEDVRPRISSAESDEASGEPPRVLRLVAVTIRSCSPNSASSPVLEEHDQDRTKGLLEFRRRGTVEEVTGRRALTLADWAREHASMFV